jgi:hypothetical protein
MMLIDDLRVRIPATPPRSTDLLPGLRRRRALRQGLLPIGFIVLFALFPLLVFLFEPATALSIRPTRTVTGRVERVSARDCMRDDVRVHYAFPATDGVTVRGSDCMSSEGPETAPRPGDEIPVVYLQSSPIDERRHRRPHHEQRPAVASFRFLSALSVGVRRSPHLADGLPGDA